MTFWRAAWAYTQTSWFPPNRAPTGCDWTGCANSTWATLTSDTTKITSAPNRAERPCTSTTISTTCPNKVASPAGVEEEERSPRSSPSRKGGSGPRAWRPWRCAPSVGVSRRWVWSQLRRRVVVWRSSIRADRGWTKTDSSPWSKASGPRGAHRRRTRQVQARI